MLSIFLLFFLICALKVNNNLAVCETDFPKNCICVQDSFERQYSCRDEKNSFTNLTVPLWDKRLGDVKLSCEKGSVSKEWYNSLKGITGNHGLMGIKLKVFLLSCPIPEEPIKKILVEKLGLSIITFSEITELHIRDVKNFDPSLSTNLFAKLPKLRIVHFENTNLQNIPSNFFQPLSNTSSFTIIFLRRNTNLSRVNVDAFKNLEFLQRIDLSDNNLNQLEDGTFSKLYKLQDLSLDHNRLNQLGSDIFKDLTDLEYLNLHNNNLATLTGKIFTPLRRLQRLNLEANGITTLDADVFEGLDEVRVLNLAKNHISPTILPKLISHVPNLEEIILHKNDITQLAEDTFSKSQELRRLYLRNNLLTELSDSLFQKSLKLELIDLSYNKLITLKEKQFQNLEELKELYLDTNELTSISANTFKDLKNLFILSLHNNRLTSLPDALFPDVGSKIYISLHNNPWECNCDGKYLLSLLKDSSKVSISKAEMITCAKSGLAVNSFSLQQLCP